MNRSFTAQSGTFSATFDATPIGTAGSINDVIGLSSGAQTSISNYPVLISFSSNPAGQIVARNGGSYVGGSPAINYTPGQTYHFRLAVDITTHTYSVFVTPPGGAEMTLGTGMAFRTGVTPSSLNNIGADVDATATGSVKYCSFVP